MRIELEKYISILLKEPLLCKLLTCQQAFTNKFITHQDVFYTTEMVQASMSLVTTFMTIFKFNLTKSINHIKNIVGKVAGSPFIYLPNITYNA